MILSIVVWLLITVCMLFIALIESVGWISLVVVVIFVFVILCVLLDIIWFPFGLITFLITKNKKHLFATGIWKKTKKK